VVTNIGRDCGYGSGHSVGCSSGSKVGDFNSDINSGGSNGFSSGSKIIQICIFKYFASWSGISKFSKKEILLVRLHQNITKKKVK
jgi:hypothetical protein